MPNIDKIAFSYPGVELFRNFSLEIPENEISCILGPSGCGKTTLLNLIGNLKKPDSGCISGFANASFSYIFQETRILPWRTVFQNIVFPLWDKMKHRPAVEKAEKFMALVELSEWKDKYPAELSGGMKQRIAIARAFAFPSQTILMDEAFQALDSGLKNKIFEVFLRSWFEEPRTVVFVTHNPDEAFFIGNNIHVLSDAPISEVSSFVLNGKPCQGRTGNEATKKEILNLLK